MDKIICYACGQPANYYFFAKDYIVALLEHEPNDYVLICDECNKSVSIKVKTYPLFKVLRGGKNG